MKTNALRLICGFAAIAAVASISTTALAGPPSPSQLQRQRDRAAAERRAAAAPEMARCPSCRTDKVTEYTAYNPSGKYAPTIRIVGTKHTCSKCDGAISTIRGKTSGKMASSHAGCANEASCCKTAG